MFDVKKQTRVHILMARRAIVHPALPGYAHKRLIGRNDGVRQFEVKDSLETQCGTGVTLWVSQGLL